MRLDPDKLAAMRADYQALGLHECDMDADPIAQFQHWFSDAIQASVPEPNAMTLATATPDGAPAARLVLLKGAGPDGLVFFTNYESRKAREIAANARVALVCYWHELARQVRIEGYAARVSREESEAYFHSRPRESQIGAWASRQSSPLKSRDELEQTFAAQQKEFEGREVPLPPSWGGYRVTPRVFEFWQGRANRLHDRIRYTREDEASPWRMERLAP